MSFKAFNQRTRQWSGTLYVLMAVELRLDNRTPWQPAGVLDITAHARLSNRNDAVQQATR